MAISDGTAGAWVATTTRNPTVTLPAHTAGQMLLVRVGWKSATPTTDVAVCATSGWAKLGQFYDSGGASSNGGGGVLVAVFWKVATSDAETNPVIEFDDATAPTPGCYAAVSYSKGAAEAWVTPAGDGGAIAAATSYSGTIQSHVSATSGDMLDAFAVTNDNTTLTVPTVSQSGLTLDTVTEYPATALSSSSSNDISADGCNRLATAGTSSAAAVASGTNSVADPGAAWVTRLRVEAAPQTLTPDPVATVSAVATPTVDRILALAPGPIAATTAVAAPTVASVYALAPDPVASVASVVAPTIGLFTALAPDPVATTTAVPEPTVVVDQVVAPDPVAVALAVAAPTVATLYAVAPEPVTTATAVAAPSVESVYAVSPDPVATTTTVAEPTVERTTAIAHDPVAIATAIAVPTIGLVSELAPDPVATVTAVPDPTVGTESGGATLTPDPVPVVLTVPVPVLASILGLAPDPVVAATTVPGPALDVGVVPSPVVVTLQVPASVLSLIMALAPTPVTTATGVTLPAIDTPRVVTPGPVAVATAVPVSTVSGGTMFGLPVMVLGTIEPVQYGGSAVLSGEIRGSIASSHISGEIDR